MLLTELENRFIKPLPRFDKLRLIANITKMLQDEEEIPENYFKRGVQYPVITPTIRPDDNCYGTAFQLQQLLEEHNKV